MAAGGLDLKKIRLSLRSVTPGMHQRLRRRHYAVDQAYGKGIMRIMQGAIEETEKERNAAPIQRTVRRKGEDSM